jgi:hypothetical protein
MEVDMNERQARQLAERVKREDPRIRTEVRFLEEVGRQFWAVEVIARATDYLLGRLESPSDWDELKKHLKDHP